MTPQIGAFDAGQVEPTTPREALPTGWYAMQIVASEVKQAKKSDGQYLQLELEVLEQTHPELKGRKVWERLNLWNANSQAVEIAQRSLSAICRAVGQMQISDSEVLHHKPLAVKVRKRAASEQYDESNDVTGYDAIAARFGGGAPASAPVAPPTTTAPVGGPPAGAPPAGAPPAGGAPPWQRPKG